ncbi:MAG: alpha/beta hydrolase [Desulfuromonadales bacterium]|jgi:pimeloyl-ACP methyl ester carboxylesterase|nr:alpha/beta hydrolase [Desulfuromonadales bacterium]
MYATVNGVNLYYDDHGRGPAVLFIHDFPLNSKMWQPQVEAVAEAGFRVITPDLRGFGNSEHKTGAAAISTYSEDIIGLLNFLGIGRAVICGLSMGGYILFDLLENHPHRVAGACMVSTRPVADDIHERAKRSEFLIALNKGQVDNVREELCNMLIGDREEKIPKSCREKILSLTRGAEPAALINAILAITRRKDYTFQLKNMRIPTLIIGAEQDRITHPQHSEIMARQLPNCYKAVKLNCGHLVNMEKVQAFNAHLIEFLSILNPQTRRVSPIIQPAI